MVRVAWQGFEWELRATLQQIKIQSQPGHVCRDRLRGLVIRWALLARNIHRRSRELEAFPSEVLGARTPEDRLRLSMYVSAVNGLSVEAWSLARYVDVIDETTTYTDVCPLMEHAYIRADMMTIMTEPLVYTWWHTGTQLIGRH